MTHVCVYKHTSCECVYRNGHACMATESFLWNIYKYLRQKRVFLFSFLPFFLSFVFSSAAPAPCRPSPRHPPPTSDIIQFDRCINVQAPYRSYSTELPQSSPRHDDRPRRNGPTDRRTQTEWLKNRWTVLPHTEADNHDRCNIYIWKEIHYVCVCVYWYIIYTHARPTR